MKLLTVNIVVGLLICWITLTATRSSGDQNAAGQGLVPVTREEFDTYYKPWLECVGKNSASPRTLDTYWGGTEGHILYNKIIALGPGAMPYIIDEMEKGQWRLNGCALCITQKRFPLEEYSDLKSYGGAQPNAALFVKWWRHGRGETPGKFTRLYEEEKELRAQGRTKDAEMKLDQIRWLGIEALPYLMEKVEQGDSELIPVIAKLTQRTKVITNNMNVQQVVEWWQRDKKKWELPTTGMTDDTPPAE